MSDLFTHRLSVAFVIVLTLCGLIYFFLSVFAYKPLLETQCQVRPEIEIHFGGPPLQEKE